MEGVLYEMVRVLEIKAVWDVKAVSLGAKLQIFPWNVLR